MTPEEYVEALNRAMECAVCGRHAVAEIGPERLCMEHLQAWLDQADEHHRRYCLAVLRGAL